MHVYLTWIDRKKMAAPVSRKYSKQAAVRHSFFWSLFWLGVCVCAVIPSFLHKSRRQSVSLRHSFGVSLAYGPRGRTRTRRKANTNKQEFFFSPDFPSIILHGACLYYY